MTSINNFFDDEEQKKNTPFNDEHLAGLPLFFQEVTSKFDKKAEKDMALLASINVISGLCRNYYSYYGNDVIEPNHYAFILAPFASGKGLLGFIRHLILPTGFIKARNLPA